MEVVDEWGRKTASTIGPFFFSNPSDSKLLFSSPSLCPPILFRIPHVTPARFLTVSGGVPPSVSSSLRVQHPNDDSATALSYNRLQFLPWPCKNSVLVFFPTGSNLDQIGYLILSTGDSVGLRVRDDVVVAKERFFTRISKILVQPVSSSSPMELGYVMVYSTYSVHWYCVKESQTRPVLSYLGVKQFKRCSVASASWSPHLPGECLVLLENGEMFVFDLNQNQMHCSVNPRGCKMNVTWEEGQVNNWLGCEFGMRLGVFIVARSDAVFVITKSHGICSVRSLIEVERLNMDGRREEFVAFANAGFRFILATQSYLFLCDQRSGVPLLKWQHDVEEPCFIDVYSLSDLTGESESESESESTTSCVVVGSFWNAESQMFCYGPCPSVSVDSSSMHVWELPHNLLLPAGKCQCGDCLVREMVMKESLPESVDWQKKRVLVLGFGVLNKYLSPLEQSFGFTLIRLTSSGKLEAVKFGVSSSRSLEVAVVTHKEPAWKSDDVNLLYFPDDDEEYEFAKRFKYLQLEYLSAHRKGTLAELIDSRTKEKPSGSKKSNSFSLTCHEEICEKLSICGFGRQNRSSSSSTVTGAVFENIGSPTSVYEIALRETWRRLPIELLTLAFSNYSELDDKKKKKPSLEFLMVPDFPQLPPFLLRKPSSRSNKWSKKEKPGVDLVGPVLPLAVLELRNRRLSSDQPDVEFSDRCTQISEAARKTAYSGVDKKTGDKTKKKKKKKKKTGEEQKKGFIAYSPIRETSADSSEGKHQELTTFVSKVRRCKDNVHVGGRAGLELFDDMSPVEICFEDRNVNFDTKKMVTSKTLLSQWQNRSSSYQDFLSRYHLKK